MHFKDHGLFYIFNNCTLKMLFGIILFYVI